MVRLLAQVPPADTVERIKAIDGVRAEPATLWLQRGPDGDLGPEAAGALLMLQATFVDEQGAAEFWAAAAGLFEVLAPRHRVIFCQHCDGVTPVEEGVCRGCGGELVDPFREPANDE